MGVLGFWASYSLLFLFFLFPCCPLQLAFFYSLFTRPPLLREKRLRWING